MSEATFARPAGMPQGTGALLRLIAIPVLGFLCFGIGVASGIRSDVIGVLGLAVATAVLIVTVIALDRVGPRAGYHLLLSVVSLSYLVRMVFPVFVFYLSDIGYTEDVAPNPIPLTPAVVTLGMLAAFLSYAMLLLGYALPVGKVVARVAPQMRREWSIEIALAVALVTLPLGWFVVISYQLGLIPARAGSGLLGAISSGSIIGLGLIALCYQRYRSRMALLLLILTVPPTMIFNFFTGSKELFLMPAALIVIVQAIHKRRLAVWWIAGGVAALVLIYPVFRAYRDYAWEWGANLSAVQVILHPQRALTLIGAVGGKAFSLDYIQQGMMTTAGRLDGVGILSVIVRDAGTRVPFQNGRVLSHIPMSFVPRLLWPGKPVFDTGQWVTDYYGSGPEFHSATACTWMGALFFDLGWTGMLAGMAVVGMYMRFLSEYFLRPDAPIPALLAGILSIFTLSVSIEADLVPSTSGLIFRFIPLLLTYAVLSLLMPAPTRRVPQP